MRSTRSVSLLQHTLSALALACGLATVACGDGSHAAPSSAIDTPAPVDTSTSLPEEDAGAPACAEGHEGCPCTDPGVSVDCKVGPIHFGSLVACIVGRSTCGDDLAWGRCVGNTDAGH